MTIREGLFRRLGLALALLLAAAGTSADDRVPPVRVDAAGIAIDGYDPVAFFTRGEALLGSAEHELEWGGATWRFAESGHRDLFVAEPERYAPRFGGYCAWAVAHGYTAKGDPLAWTIWEEGLYLNYDPRIRERWLGDVRGHVEAGQENWPRLRRDG